MLRGLCQIGKCADADSGRQFRVFDFNGGENPGFRQVRILQLEFADEAAELQSLETGTQGTAIRAGPGHGGPDRESLLEAR